MSWHGGDEGSLVVLFASGEKEGTGLSGLVDDIRLAGPYVHAGRGETRFRFSFPVLVVLVSQRPGWWVTCIAGLLYSNCINC
jgi:hypothetical protein